MKTKKIIKIFLHFSLTFVSFSSLFTGLSILFKSKEKITYQNSLSYVEQNSPYNSLLIEYSPRPSINNLKINKDFKKRVNHIDSVYFNKSTFFNTTEDIEFTINGKTLTSRLSDTSYSSDNPIVSTHRIKLISGTRMFDDAFLEGKEMFSLNASSIEAHVYDDYQLQSYLGTELVENSDVTWSIDNDSVATIDNKGKIYVKNEGSAVISATYDKYVQHLTLSVVNKDTANKGYIVSVPVVLPTSLVDQVFTTRDDILGKRFTAYIGGEEYNFVIGGYYNSDVEDPFYKNNICPLIYYPRSERYYVPINTCYLRLGGDAIAINRVYNEIQLLKKVCGLKFNFLEDAPVNQIKINEQTLYERVDEVCRSWQLIVLPVALLGLSLSTFFSNIYLLNEKALRKFIPFSIYIFGVGLPLLCVYLIKNITFNGMKIPLLTPFVSWIAIILSGLAAILLLIQIIKREQKNNERVNVPVLHGTKNCIYIAKGALLPDQNASALRVNSIIEALQDSGYAFHVIGQAKYPKGSITKISENYYLHSTLDKTASANNSLKDKIESLYFPSDLIYKRVLEILESNTIDYVFIYQTLPTALMERLFSLSIRKGFKLVFDIVEYQTIAQQRKLGIFFNYFPSKKILRKYTKYGKTIAISTYLREFLAKKNREVLYVPFIFDVENLQNNDYKKSEKIRIIYAGSPIGKRDTVQNVIKGLDLLGEEDSKQFELSFVGLTRSDMKKLGATKAELKKTDPYVKYYGVIPHEKVLDLYSKSDYSLLLKPANKRFSMAGFPTKMSESWALSTPVIANYSGDIGEYLIDSLNGVVCKSDSPEDFAEALKCVLLIKNSDYLKMRAESRKTAVLKLSKNVYNKILKDFIEKE